MMKIAKPQSAFSGCSWEDVIMPNQTTLQTHDGIAAAQEVHRNDDFTSRLPEMTANRWAHLFITDVR